MPTGCQINRFTEGPFLAFVLMIRVPLLEEMDTDAAYLLHSVR